MRRERLGEKERGVGVRVGFAPLALIPELSLIERRRRPLQAVDLAATHPRPQIRDPNRWITEPKPHPLRRLLLRRRYESGERPTGVRVQIRLRMTWRARVRVRV